MTIFSLYFPLLSFLLHTVTNSFKKHIHSFMRLVATAIKCHHPISSTVDIIDGFTCCTESLGFESIDESRVDDENEDSDGCCSWRRMIPAAAEGRRNRRETKSFPPPLSSLNPNGQRSFFLQPVRKNGRLKLIKVRIKRSEVLYAWRQDGRLRMYLVPDQCEDEEEEEVVESEEDEEIRDKKEEDRVGEWKLIPMWGKEGFRRCHQVVNQSYCVHGCHHHLHMYGVGIA